MYLKTLQIKNFRCFKNYEITFSPGVTVLFGKNGVGKSTLIDSIHKVLSFIMFSNKIFNTVNGKREVVEVRTITKKNSDLYPESLRAIDCNNTEEDLIEIIASNSSLDDNTPLPIWKISQYADKGRRRDSELKEAFNTFYDWHQRTNQLPLLAYFSDSFPHVEEYKSNNQKKNNQKLNALRDERNFGYTNWNKEVDCTNIWLKRLEDNSYYIYQLENNKTGKNPNALEQINAYKNENKMVLKRLILFSESLKKAGKDAIIIESIDDRTHGLTIHTTKGKEIPFRWLPAGYKRIFSIVLDLAYRSYILSEGQSTDIAGVVMIDEIDLHLHPELERVVLQGLTETFPNTQFIVSTHSPLVLSNISTKDERNSILRMEPLDNLSDDEGYEEEEEEEEDTDAPTRPLIVKDIYGLDYNTIVHDSMELDDRDDIQNWAIEELKFLMDNNMPDAAEEIKRRILGMGKITEDELNRRIGQ